MACRLMAVRNPFHSDCRSSTSGHWPRSIPIGPPPKHAATFAQPPFPRVWLLDPDLILKAEAFFREQAQHDVRQPGGRRRLRHRQPAPHDLQPRRLLDQERVHPAGDPAGSPNFRPAAARPTRRDEFRSRDIFAQREDRGERPRRREQRERIHSESIARHSSAQADGRTRTAAPRHFAEQYIGHFDSRELRCACTCAARYYDLEPDPHGDRPRAGPPRRFSPRPGTTPRSPSAARTSCA